ncbi:MAG: hydroxymethylbilane synthase [Gammaproteobacteria bacterium]|nr:hydroxymethylbilane synthase [Gammaproteobacteria bacterium]
MIQQIGMATRRSRLSLWQADFVAAEIKSLDANLQIEIVPITTTGDRRTDVHLAQIGGKGLFIEEIEHCLREQEADIAVHCLKDLPGDMPDDCVIAAVLERGNPSDVLVSRDESKLDDLPKGATIGTCSLRRASQIKAYRRDLQIVPMRGNVDTRISKLDQGDCDALVLAAIGLERLELQHRITETLSHDICLPAVGQGTLIIECSADRDDLKTLIGRLQHHRSYVAATAERTLTQALNADCHSAIGVYARYINDHDVHLEAMVADPEGNTVIRDQATGSESDPVALGEALAAKMQALGAEELLHG